MELMLKNDFLTNDETMTDITKHTLNQDATLLDAIEKLNAQSSDLAMTAFVVDHQNRVLGSITDGDVRRALLKFRSLEMSVNEIVNPNFKRVEHGQIDVRAINQYKKAGIKIIPVVDQNGVLVEVINLNKHNSILPIDAVLMAGGRGERLRPMTLATPKPLLEVGGKPIIDYNVENLLSNGIENINVTINYLGEQIEEHFSSPRPNGVQVKCIREPKYLGTIGSIKFVETWHNDTILVMNSDLFTNINLEDFFLHFKDHDADMSIAAVPYSVSVPYGIFDIDGARNIVGIKEKPSYHYYANAGIYLIKKEMLDMIPDDEFFNATDLMQQLIDKGKSVIRFPLSGYWIDIGKPEDFKKTQDIAQHIHR